VRPLRGMALVVLDPKLVFTVVDNFFGGDGRFHAKIEGREFTLTEMRVVQMILKQVYKDLKEAWNPVAALEFEYVNSEVNPQFANIVSPSEVVVVMQFHVEFDKGGGDLHVTMPYAMLEPLRELLMAGVQSDRVEYDERWTVALREEMKEARVGLSCHLADAEITLGELMRLNAGDVISIDLPGAATVRVEGLSAFRCHYGAFRGATAVKIVEPIKRNLPVVQ